MKFVLFFILSLHGLGHAGGLSKGPGSGNGGNTAIVDGQVRFLDMVRLPDTVIYNHKGVPAYQILKNQLAAHDGYNQATYFPASDPLSVPIGQKIMSSLDRLVFYIVMNGEPLPDPKDTGFVALPWNFNGRIERFALQDPKTRRVLVDGALLSQMDDRDIASFFLHEALIRAWYDDFNNVVKKGERQNRRLESTAKIADIVNMTFVPTKFTRNLSPIAVAKKMCEAGIKVSADNLPGLKQMRGWAVRRPAYPTNFWIFVNDDCSIRQFRKTGAWSSQKMAPGRYFDQLPLMEISSEGEFPAKFIYMNSNADFPTYFEIESDAPADTNIGGLPSSEEEFSRGYSEDNFRVWVR